MIMANKKDLKKDIKKAFAVLYNDLAFYMVFVKGKDRDDAKKLFDKILPAENELISKINVKPKDIKGKKQDYFAQITKQSIEILNGFFDEMSKLSHE